MQREENVRTIKDPAKKEKATAKEQRKRRPLLKSKGDKRRKMEEGKPPPYGWLVETEGRKELWMSFAEDGFPDIMKVGSYSNK